MTLFSELIDETALALTGYTSRQDQATFLTAPLNATDLTFVVADGTVLTRGIVEIDEELIWVDSFNRTTNTATVPPYGRGFRDTTPVPHTAGTRVTVTPSFPRAMIRKDINEAIDAIAVSWQTIGPSLEWLPVRHYRIDRTANPIIWNSGKTISISDGIIPGRTVQVVYTKKPTQLQNDNDDFTTSGLPDSAREVIILGAAYRSAAYVDMGRVPASSAEAGSMDQSNPVGSATNMSRYFYQMYQQRLQVEMARQAEQYPPRTHYSR